MAETFKRRLSLGAKTASNRPSEAARAASEALARSPFPLLGSDGMPLRGLDLGELRRLEGEGCVPYFSAQADSAGLHRAVHPLTAQTMTPKNLVVFLRPNGDAPSGRYGSLESPTRSGDKGFYTIKTGVQGKYIAPKGLKPEDCKTLKEKWGTSKKTEVDKLRKAAEADLAKLNKRPTSVEDAELFLRSIPCGKPNLDTTSAFWCDTKNIDGARILQKDTPSPGSLFRKT
ncbi:MAG: hypothetical protein HY922_05905 [Elusimicrobia bacterium]|nr:hypothetical protein [Elusimicrobiota bacterium]